MAWHDALAIMISDQAAPTCQPAATCHDQEPLRGLASSLPGTWGYESPCLCFSDEIVFFKREKAGMSWTARSQTVEQYREICNQQCKFNLRCPGH